MLLILVGKSGCGKDTIARELVKRADFIPLVSTTTRPMREGETNGVDYNFVSKEVFGSMIMDGDFLEYSSHEYSKSDDGKSNLWFYGTPKEKLDDKENYVKIADIDGAKAILDYYGRSDCFVAYVYAEDVERQKRVKSRGSFDLDDWKSRLDDDVLNFTPARVDEVANYICLNNDGNLDFALYHLKTVFNAYKAKAKIPNEKYVCAMYEDAEGDCCVRVVNEKDSEREIPKRIKRLEKMGRGCEE